MDGSPSSGGDAPADPSEVVARFGLADLAFGPRVPRAARPGLAGGIGASLANLSRATGIPEGSIGLGSRLTVVVGGSLDRGRDAEYRDRAIRLRARPRGALSHEYGHFIDEHVGELLGGGDGWGSAAVGWPDAYGRHYDSCGDSAVAHAMRDVTWACRWREATVSRHVAAEVAALEAALGACRARLAGLSEASAGGGPLARWDATAGRLGEELATMAREAGATARAVPTEAWAAAAALDEDERGPAGAGPHRGLYWRLPCEVFARAFEGFCARALADAGVVDGMLASSPGRLWWGRQPYPMGEEADSAESAIATLLSAVADGLGRAGVEGAAGP